MTQTWYSSGVLLHFEHCLKRCKSKSQSGTHFTGVSVFISAWFFWAFDWGFMRSNDACVQEFNAHDSFCIQKKFSRPKKDVRTACLYIEFHC